MIVFRCSLPIVILFSLQAAVFAVEDKAVDDAVVRALGFVAELQKSNGSWEADSGNQSTAVTSLAVMAFLAAGHVPGEGSYGRAINNGIAFVLAHQNANGMLVSARGRGPMYDHGISTLMLAEVAGMTKQEQASQTRKALEKAVQLIIQAQRVRKSHHDFGGWRYQHNSQDSDLSVTAWQLLALRAAKDIGCDVPLQSIESAIEYVNNCASGNGFAYQPGHGTTTNMTASGVLALQICDHHDDASVARGIGHLQNSPLRFGDSWFFYGAYYNSISVYKYGAADWNRTKSQLFGVLLSNQKPTGGWTAQNLNEAGHGPVYATSLSVLALTVEYGYLPIYQR